MTLRFMARKRRLAVGGGAAAVGGGVAAVILIFTGSSLSPAAVVARAATRTADAGTSRVVISGRDEGAAIRLEGLLNYESGSASFTVGTELGSASKEPYPPEEVRLVDGVTYVKVPTFARQYGSDRTWLSVPFDQDNALGELFWKRFLNPAELLANLQAVAGVERVASEPVRGVNTTHYRGLLDLRSLIAREPASTRAKLLEDLESGERTSLPFDLWIDDDGLARRLRTGDWASPDPDPITVEFFDFGVDAAIQAPPPNEVITPDELSQLAERNAAECDRGGSSSGGTASGNGTICLSVSASPREAK